jgi:flagellar basal-body rod protein FlgB
MNKLDSLFSFQQTALNLRAQRQELLAANIANSDTPNYKARDIDFAATLKNAMGASGSQSNTVVGADSAASSTSSSSNLLPSLPSVLGSAAGLLAKTSPLHMAMSAAAGMIGSAVADPSQVKYRAEIQGSADGNTVDGDVERNQFADNALRYEAGLTALRGDIKDMQVVLQG